MTIETNGDDVTPLCVAQRAGGAYVVNMRTSWTKVLSLTLGLVVAVGALDATAAATKKRSIKPAKATHVIRDYDGTPIKAHHPTYGIPDIMIEERGRTRAAPAPRVAPRLNADRPMMRPRGSSTYIPPPVPSPDSPNSPPSPVLLQPPPPPVVPPRINTFQDRVINCIHSAPLNAGVGNNPANTQAYIGQCAN